MARSKYDRSSPILAPPRPPAQANLRGALRQPLVLRLGRVNLVHPVENAASEVEHPLESDGSQEIGRLCAPRAHLAVHDNLLVGIELLVAPRHVAQRDQDRPWYPIDLVLVGFADVDDLQGVATVEPLFQLDRRDFRCIVLNVLHGCGLRGGMNPAELLVIDQLFHGRMSAAHRAVGILAKLQFPEPHAQRIENQKTADERFADSDDQLDRFSGLNRTDDAWQHAEHAPLRAARHESGRRWFGIQAAIAWAVLGREYGGLPFETEDAAVSVWFTQ